MKIWKNLFGNKENLDLFEKPLPNNFNELTRIAIELIGRDSETMENEQLQEYLLSNGIPEFEAVELITFIPIAFCRKLLPELNWLPIYIDFYSQKNQIKRKYSDNKRYLVIEEETEKYWSGNPDNKWILNISKRSSEFHAINQLLNDGGRLEDVRLTEVKINR